MRKRERKSAEVDSETAGGGIAAAIAQDIELTAEQIRDAAHNAVVAVEKIAGLKRSRARKPVARKGAAKKIARARPRAKTAPAKSSKRKIAKPKTRRNN